MESSAPQTAPDDERRRRGPFARLRRTERAQLLGILLVVAVAIAGAAVLGVRHEAAQARADTAHRELNAVHSLEEDVHRLQVDHLAQRLTGDAREAGTVLDVRARVAAIGDADPLGSTTARDARQAMLSDLDALLVATARDRPRALTGRGAAAGLAGPVIGRLDRAAHRWAEAARAEASAVDRAVVRHEEALKATVLGLAAFIVVGGALPLMTIRRSRARLTAEFAASRGRLEAMSRADSLTGLANHGAFNEELVRTVAEAHASGSVLSLAILDADHFKRINDAYGHQHGDRVLVQLAARLRALAPPGHFLARIGGEEFAWLMPGLDAATAAQLVEQSRDAIARRPIGEHGDVVTVSCGVAELDESTDPHDLVRRADRALYVAKAAGRDAVSLDSAPEPTRAPAVSAPEISERLRTLAGLRTLASGVDAKAPATRRHSQRVADLAAKIAERLGWASACVTALHQAAMVHDVGKIGVPDAVLLKAAPLSTTDWGVVRRHPELGAEMLANVLSAPQISWIRHHHERWDGAGYPARLAGEEIPEGARILAVADAWDAMTVARAHARPLDRASALAEIQREAGRQFCPRVAATLLALSREGELGGSAGDRAARHIRLVAGVGRS